MKEIDAVEHYREEWRREMQRRGWDRSKFSLAPPHLPRRRSIARTPKRVERIWLALLPEPWWSYEPRKGRPTWEPTCTWDWYALQESKAAWREYRRRRGSSLGHRLRRDPRLARRLRAEFARSARTRGGGTRPAHQSPESLANALAAIELGKRNARTIARAPARLMRAMGH